MRIGYCANLNFLLKNDERSGEIFNGVLSAGYDYIELPLSALLLLSPSEYTDIKKRLADAGVPCRANVLLFPSELTLVGDKRNLHAICEHAKKVLPVAADLGSEVVVFGNGGTRRIPDGMSYDTVRRQLVDILQMVNPIAASYNIKIALEPLCTRETNMVTSFPEAAEIAIESGHATGAVFDLYHGIVEGQSPQDITFYPEKAFHLHIAYPNGRTIPNKMDDDVHYREFAKAIKQCGYDNKLSIEGGVPVGKDAARAIADAYTYLRRYF